MNSSRSIRIPLAGDNNKGLFVEIFPDELPEDVNDVLDVLKAELAPLKIWKAVAVEYYRQGQSQHFEAVLNEIVSTIEQDKKVEQYYRDNGEYKEGIVEIFDALAAYALDRSLKSVGENERKKEVFDFIQKADAINQRNEYTWLIKGFFELAFGNIDNAEYSLKNVYDRATTKPGAQRSERNSQSSDKKIFLFGSLLGLGTLAFMRKKYSTALEYFSKALHQNPKSGANVRVAIASCTFKLEQYDRTRAALDRALALDPTNVDALVLLSLVERVESHKADKKKRNDCRAIANELCVLAAQIDPTCAMALNHLANYSFYSWRLIHPSGLISSQKEILLSPAKGVPALEVGDMLQIRKSFVTTIASVNVIDNQVEVTLATEIPPEWVGDKTLVEMKDNAKINEVKTLTTRALRATNNPNIKAESFYIFGRLYHMMRDYDIATQLYEEALNWQPDMPLAAFGLGQLHMAKQNYSAALEKFNLVLARQPDDRDTQAYVMLLQSLHKKESASFDKLREIAPGFAFEADLWLSQGHTIQMKGPGEYPAALKCYEMAYDCMLRQNLVPQSKMLLNMGILYHSLGNLKSANDFVRRSLAPTLMHSVEASAGSPVFHRPENDIFYHWETSLLTVRVEECPESSGLDNTFNVPLSQLCMVTLSEESSSESFPDSLRVGDDLLVSDVVLEILQVNPSQLICKGFFSALDRYQSHSHGIRIKKSDGNFNHSNLTNCFTLARIQEDRGHLQAAREIYSELLKLRPTFIECYLRLSLMAKEIGKLAEANRWASMALEIDPNHSDAIIVHGDLCALSEKWDLAKGKYEKICRQRHHDSRALLSLGNMYYANISVKESSLKDSMKFYHMVLKEDQRNIYAANGLGMVCAAKEQADIAREIFSRVRETGLSPASDVCVNLGHMHLSQGRYVDAIHIYQATLKSLPTSPAVRMQSEVMGEVSDCLSLSYLKNSQHDDSIRVLLKSLHYDPSRLHDWFNVACVKEELAVKLCRSQTSSISDISLAIGELEHATGLFRSLKSNELCPGIKRHELFHAHKAGQHEKFCLDAVEKAKNKLSRAQVEADKKEQNRLRQAEENRARMALKQAEREKEEEAKMLSRLEQQELAKQKEREFEELRKSWAVTPGEKKTAGDRKKKKQPKRDETGNDADQDQDQGEKKELIFSDSESEVEAKSASGDDAAIFGSDSEEESSKSHPAAEVSTAGVELYDSDDDTPTPAAPSNGNLRRKRPADALEDDNEDELFGSSAAENTSVPQKQRRVVDDDEELEAEADF